MSPMSGLGFHFGFVLRLHVVTNAAVYSAHILHGSRHWPIPDGDALWPRELNTLADLGLHLVLVLSVFDFVSSYSCFCLCCPSLTGLLIAPQTWQTCSTSGPLFMLFLLPEALFPQKSMVAPSHISFRSLLKCHLLKEDHWT